MPHPPRRRQSPVALAALLAAAALLSAPPAADGASGSRSSARRPVTPDAALPTPSKGCAKPVPRCTQALEDNCGKKHVIGHEDECELCAGEHEHALKKAGCTDQEIDA